ncbi:Glycine--tRNA ligase [Hondaea fermentalgiana]|uniref:glycine--tRNA ligase n=1 Tax=Hondaea fermentalgiana TaxID=2315210 RepID=A0A2R5G695_9STRA|nr:Glycine--tRNA ligase [Hondaea fermentalgiana]|eukprot:GBG26577.1 Glycine--tRNA ligase [Hondaea fermentalgiana]
MATEEIVTPRPVKPREVRGNETMSGRAATSAARGAKDLQEIVRLCKTRGFVFASNDIHGGFANSFDFGPLGVLLKRNIEQSWWRRFVTEQDACYGLDSSVMLPPVVWEKSGHLQNFSDPLVDCRNCGKRYRADHLCEAEGNDETNRQAMREVLSNGKCPCGKLQPWGEEVSKVRDFNLMFETLVGPVVEDGAAAFFRPETAQGTYLNFGNYTKTAQPRLPLGIAQVGKAFRNEVTPGQFLFRTREFEQMELQWFCRDEEAEQWFDHWLAEGLSWLHGTIGVRPESVRLCEHDASQLAHYARRTTDIEFKYPFGWGELWGFANRGTYDLSCHGVEYREPGGGKSFVPTVIEPALGLNRLVLAVLCDAFREETVITPGGDGAPDKEEKRTVLGFEPSIAPYALAVMPLVKNNAEQRGMSEQLVRDLRAASPHLSIVLETSSGSIGKRYRRYDEIGTPYCVTVDYDAPSTGQVTVRDRDSMAQVRIAASDLMSMNLTGLQRAFAEH